MTSSNEVLLDPDRDDALPQAVVGKLGTLDRFLPVWIGLAMALGLAIGRLVPGSAAALEAIEIDGISVPIAVGLLVMMYPPLAKVRYNEMGSLTGDRSDHTRGSHLRSHALRHGRCPARARRCTTAREHRLSHTSGLPDHSGERPQPRGAAADG